MTKFRTHIRALGLFLFAFGLTVMILGGCGRTVNPQADARATVVEYTTALQKRNFYDACALYADDTVKGLGAAVSGPTGIAYSDIRACAVNLVSYEAQSLAFGATVFDNMVVADEPTTKGAPKNGYFYEVKYLQGTVKVAVQRNSDGEWRVVGISG